MTTRKVIVPFGLLVLLSLLIASLSTASAEASSPYGLSVWGYQQRVSASHVGWVRLQRDWKSIETSAGVYDWTGMDQDVAAANAAGVKISVPIQDAPDFRLTQSCDGSMRFPGPNEVSTFASAMAARYNGHNGHGYIDSFEIGNEEWDNYWGGSWAASLPCRQPSLYGPVLKAGYQAIKAQSPTAVVGMFGLWWLDTGHFHDYLTWLYQNGYGSDMDFANFHYYGCSADPSVTSGSTPSYTLAWQTLRQVQQNFGDGGKPIWTTEVGWTVSGVSQNAGCAVSLQTQSQYELEVLESARTSGAVQRVFLYTINDTNSDGMNLYPPSGPLPAYQMLQNEIASYPTWGGAAPPPPSPTPTPVPTPVPTPSATTFQCVVSENGQMVVSTCTGSHSP